jgi:membrane-associated protein
MTYNLIGAAAWSMLATLLGYALGKRYPKIESYLTPVILVIVFVSLIPVLLELRKSRTAS